MPSGSARRTGKPLAAHLRKRPATSPSNTVPIRPREEYGVVLSSRRLLVRFAPLPGAKPQTLDLSEWLDRADLGLAVAHHLADWGRGHSPSTRVSGRKLLRNYLTFLRETEAGGFEQTLSVSDVSSESIAMYVAWLDGKLDLIESEREPLANSTKALRFNAFKEMVAFWKGSDRYASSLRPDLRMPRNPWPGRHHLTKSTEVLDPVSLARVRQAAIDEIVADLGIREQTFAAAQDDTILLPLIGSPSVVPYKDLRVKLRLTLETFHGRLPTMAELAAFPGLRRAMTPPYGTLAEVAERLHFSARALVPYVVLLGVDTTFNGEGLLGLSWSEVKEHPIFGADRWQISVPKPRAVPGDGERGMAFHRRSFAAKLTAVEAPVNLLRALKRYTCLTRRHVPDRHKDKVFVFHSVKTGAYRSYESATHSATDDALWKMALKAFIADHDLPEFTLRTLRSTGGDVVNQLTGDIKAHQTVLGHGTPGITLKHYKSGAAKQRDEESLSVGMGWRHRFIETQGRSDTRNGALLPGGHTATTPGFGCVDPFDSPIPGQRPGKPCSAFGACPVCPLAAVNPDDPRLYARLRQFKEKLIEARSTIDPARFLEAWAPQLSRLDGYWLPRFSEKAIAGAALALPPFPDLE